MDPIRLVVPVRFSGGGLSMQTTTSKVGLDRVFIRCMVSPKSGAPLKIELTLPGAEAMVEVTAVCGDRVAPGDRTQDVGFWALLDALSEYAHRCLSKAVGATTPPAGTPPVKTAATAKEPAAPAKRADQTRAFERVKMRLQVAWSTPREFLVAYSENISRGGIFVATQKPPELREVVELLLHLPDGEGPAQTDAQVVHRVTPEQAKGRVAGAGLQFIGSDDAFRERLDRCIENLLASERS